MRCKRSRLGAALVAARGPLSIAIPALGVAMGTMVGCGSDADPERVEAPAPPRDPEHCVFEERPTSETKPARAPAKLRAGVGSAVLEMPIGAPLGGYGERLQLLNRKPTDARRARFNTAFAPSVGIHDAPRADALAIDSGGEVAVIVRLDVPLLTENSLFELESAAAPDGSLRGRIVLTASHTHGGWAGWQPSLTLMVGADKPRPELAARIVGGAAKAVRDALAALAPARIGITTDERFDPQDAVTNDRRKENDGVVGPDGNTAGKGKDATLWAMRIDREDGTPMAAVVDFGIHGTVGKGENVLVTGDAPSAIGRALRDELGVPVLHLQGAAGDIAPSGETARTACADEPRCLDMPRLEVLGARAAALIAPVVRSIQTGDAADIEVVTRTFYSGRNAKVVRPDGRVLEYTPYDEERVADQIIFDEQGRVATPIDEFNTQSGAGLCGNPNANSLAPIRGGAPGVYNSCVDVGEGRAFVFSIFDAPTTDPVPMCDTIRTTSTAIRFTGTPTGDWLLVTIPGEPTAPYAAYLRGRSPAGAGRTLVVGYANDFPGYILTAEDWLAGGYEPSTNLWGPLEGEIILDGIVETAKLAWTPEREDPETGSSRFVAFVYPPSPPIVPLATTDHGTALKTPAPMWWPDAKDVTVTSTTTVARAVGAARFAWYGGDPAVDFPEVTIERETAPGMFAPLMDERGRVASSYDGVAVLTYTPEPLDAAVPTHHRYGATWQPVPSAPYSLDAPLAAFSLPVGRYRFHVKGKALAGAPTTYEISSDPFEVTAAPLSSDSTATKTTTGFAIRALLGAAPGLRALRSSGSSDAAVPLPGPWTVDVGYQDTTTKTFTVVPDDTGAGTLPLDAAALMNVVSVAVRDQFGNGGPARLE